MIQLHPFQLTLKRQVLEAWQRVRSVLMVLPTGGGKTVIFSDIMHDHAGAAVAVVHRREIVAQISMSLARLDVKHRVVAPPATVRTIRRKHLREFGKSWIDPTARCGVASVQTLTSKSTAGRPELRRWLDQITLAVFDEGHHYVESGVWARAIDAVPRAKLLFVTATPERADGKGLGSHAHGFADAMVEGPTTAWLTNNGFLSAYRYFAPGSDLDVEGVAVTATGDFNAKALRQRVVQSHIVGDAVARWRQFAQDKKTIGFASDVATAREFAEAFLAAGIPAAALCGETDIGERERVLDDFERGGLLVLFNVDLFDEGFDVPHCEAAILARPTESLAKYLQQVGRVLRVFEGKTHAYIIDMVSNWERHGQPNWPRVWTLDARASGGSRGKADTVAQRLCLSCTQPYEAFYPTCPYCGAAPAPPGRQSPRQVDGDLFELDVEALAALFAAVEAADMPDEDYALGQVARDIPPVGRGADMKRHQAARYRRGVLRELVAWWMGCQPPERTLAEKHRRFFHRFGVDVATAFTLKAPQTDALILRIQQRFTEDLAA